MVSQHEQSPGATAVPDTVENYIDRVWTPSTNDDGQPLTRRQAGNSHRARFRVNQISTRRSELLTAHSRGVARHRWLSTANISSRLRPNSTSVSTTSWKRSRASTARRSERRKARFIAGVRACFGRETATWKTWHAAWTSSRSVILSCVRGDYVAPPHCTPNTVARRASTATRATRAMSASAFVRRWIPSLQRLVRSGVKTRSTSYIDKTIEIGHWYGE